MPTDRRSLTSPINGRKSTGPKTTEGKAISANNNLRHGILARNIVLDDESSERFNALANEFHQQLQPRDFVESTLVDTLVVARWRQIRLRSMEKASLSHEMRNKPPDSQPSPNQPGQPSPSEPSATSPAPSTSSAVMTPATNTSSPARSSATSPSAPAPA